MTEPHHSDRAHALLSASGASRWLNCPPAPRLEELFPDETSPFAEEGTLAHELCEISLRLALNLITKKDFDKAFKKLSKSELFSDEMVEHAETYVNYVIEEFRAAQMTTSDARLLIEEKIDLRDLIRDGFGTGDVCIITDGVLHIIDLKYGKGVKVSASENSQLKLYGWGALNTYGIAYDIHTVCLHIVQPRLDHIDSWSIVKIDLIRWAEEKVRPAAELAYRGEGEMQAGDWCRWCKAKARCKCLADASLEAAKKDFKDTRLLNDEELITIYHQLDRITGWVQAVESYVLSEAIAGKDWPGLKLVEGRSIRTWSNPEEATNLLLSKGFAQDEVINSKIKGIGDIEKLVGKKVFPDLLGPYVVKPQGKPTLAPIDDKRPKWVENQVRQAQSDFLEN